MKLEMHAHDCEVSQCAVITAKDLVDGYKDAGYDGIVITNHFDQMTLHILGATPEGSGRHICAVTSLRRKKVNG